MTALGGKVLRDLSLEGTRTVLVVFAIAIGIAGFTTVLSAYAVLTREMNRAYLATDPASATLEMDRVDEGLIAAVLSNRAVSRAEARRIVSGRIKGPNGEWHGLKLFVDQDLGAIRIGKLELERGARTPATGEMLVERDAFGVAHLRAGDTVTVKTVSGREQTVRISGSVHDVGQAQARMENVVYGYVTVDTLARLGEAPYLDRLNILVSSGRFDETHIRSVAAEVKKLAESRGHTVRRVVAPKPGEHPHAHIMGLLFGAMSSFGFCILALSGILVVNLVTAMMAVQVRQIGVMKAVGATRARIAAIYFSQALLLGTAAIAIALPVGIAGGGELCRAMASLLNFDISSYAAPVWVYLLAAAAGWAVPIVAAAYPVWKGSRVTIRQALGDFGLSSDAFGAGVFDRAVARVGGPLRPLLLALRNSFRKRTRLALTLATLVAGGLFFMTGLNVRASLIETLDRYFAGRKFDLALTLDRMYPADAIERAIRNTPGIARAESWMVSEGAMGKEHLRVVARPAGSRLLKLTVLEGRDLELGDRDAMVLNSAAADMRGRPRVGDRVTVQVGTSEMPFRVVGFVRERFAPPTGYVPIDFPGATTGNAGAARMANGIRLALVRRDRASIEGAGAALEKNLEREHVKVQSSASDADLRFSFDQHMLMIYIFLVVVSAIIAAIGGLGLMTTMSLNVLERRRELGVLRAIGAAPVVVQLIVVTEGVVVGVWSWMLAAIAAWPLSKVLGNALGAVFANRLDFRFEAGGLVMWLVVSILLGAVASFVPAWRASRIVVREALSQG